MIYDPQKMLLIAGPCSLENRSISFTVAEKLASIRDRYPEIKIIFKGSFDKANRTSLSTARGPGIHEGLAILDAVKKEFSLPVVTDIHHPEQASLVGTVCDVIQIPAFLCRQTDLLIAAAETGRTINVKKGQFLAPQDMQFVIEKLKSKQANEVWQTERGTFFGYHNLVVDMRSFSVMRQFGRPVIFDAHAVQSPGGKDGLSGGDRTLIPPLALSAIGAGADGLFIESHPCPDKAISDSASQLALEQLPDLVKKALAVWKIVR